MAWGLRRTAYQPDRHNGLHLLWDTISFFASPGREEAGAGREKGRDPLRLPLSPLPTLCPRSRGSAIIAHGIG